jgi:stearoyl-CoA desaturase (delta-9 desaturase)
MGGQHSPIWWVSLHNRLHHPYADRIEDLHSPIHGKFHAYIGWMFSIDPKKVNFIRSGELVKDRSHMFFHKNYLKIFWGSIFFFYLVLDLATLLTLIIIPIFLAMHQENIVNVFCHLPTVGYRNFDTNDNSRNIHLLGLLFWGQGYHNNHHAYPKKYDFAMKRGEFDICKYVVPFIVWIDKKTARTSLG